MSKHGVAYNKVRALIYPPNWKKENAKQKVTHKKLLEKMKTKVQSK